VSFIYYFNFSENSFAEKVVEQHSIVLLPTDKW
jgi:hypothetical protein